MRDEVWEVGGEPALTEEIGEISEIERKVYAQAVVARRKAMSDFSKELLTLQIIDDIFEHHGRS